MEELLIDELNASCPAVYYSIDLESMNISPICKGKTNTDYKSNSCNNSLLDNDGSDSVSGQGDMVTRKGFELFNKAVKSPKTMTEIEKKLENATKRRNSLINEKKQKNEAQNTKVATVLKIRAQQMDDEINKKKISLEEDIARKLTRRQLYLAKEQEKAKRQIEKVEEVKKVLLEMRFEDNLRKIKSDLEEKERKRTCRLATIVDNCKSHIDRVKMLSKNRKSDISPSNI